MRKKVIPLPEELEKELLKILRKRSCPDRESTSERVIPENMRRLTPSTERMEYMNFVRTIALLLRVVTPHTLC